MLSVVFRHVRLPLTTYWHIDQSYFKSCSVCFWVVQCEIDAIRTPKSHWRPTTISISLKSSKKLAKNAKNSKLRNLRSWLQSRDFSRSRSKTYFRATGKSPKSAHLRSPKSGLKQPKIGYWWLLDGRPNSQPSHESASGRLSKVPSTDSPWSGPRALVPGQHGEPNHVKVVEIGRQINRNNDFCRFFFLYSQKSRAIH